MTRAWSAVGVVLLALGLVGAGEWSTANVLALRNTLGYAHFMLAYIFTWGVLRRQLGGRAAVAYLAIFLALVATYAVSQAVWLPRWANDVFVMSLFAVHHFANEILIRRQEANGYRPFTWTMPDTLVVALVTGFVLLERAGGPLLTMLWAACWVTYLWSQRHSVPGLLGCLALGGLAVVSVARPIDRAILTSRLAFDWLVIYHYVLWYVFYTRKLHRRITTWTSPRPAPSVAAVWTYLVTVPAGFLGLVVATNLLIVGALAAARPLTIRAEMTTGLDFFQVHTVAHILFGVGIAQLAAIWTARAASQPAAVENRIGAPPDAIRSRKAS